MLNYSFDNTGRPTGITGSGFGSVSTFASNMQYRAWGTMKSATMGNGVVESAGYNSRLQMTNPQIQQSNNQAGASSTYQYYNDGALRFSHSLDDRFDRAFSYDNAARVSEAYSGSEARDFINGTNSGTPTGPYRQSYQYSGFDQIAQQTNRLWSQTRTANNTFVNNRLQGWSYDADGRLINDGSTNYGRDAAGLLVQTGYSTSYYVNKYDGEGRLTRTSIQYQDGSETFIHYYLNSSVLGLAVSKLTSNGQRQESYVYAGGKKIATASPQQAVWVHEDPVTSSHGISLTSGLYGPDAEFNSDGVNVGFAEPTQPAPDFPDFKYPEVVGSYDCYVGNPNCMTCLVDSVEHDCRDLGNLLKAGAVRPCPDNDCGPRTVYNPETRRHELQLVDWDRNSGQLGWWSREYRSNPPKGVDFTRKGPNGEDIIYVGTGFWADVWHYSASTSGLLDVGFGFGLDPPQNPGQKPGSITGTVVDISCNPDVIAAMKRAWARSGNGTSGNEAGFVLNGTVSNYQIVDTKSGNTKGYQSFTINTGGPDRTFLLFHVHPNNGTRFPSTPQNNVLGNDKGDTGVAQDYNVLFMVGHRDGLTIYDPKTNRTTDLRKNLDWTKPCK